MELDPLYVDVIVRRWEQFTGQRASRGEGAQIPGERKSRKREARRGS
jgi:hypothetical protein